MRSFRSGGVHPGAARRVILREDELISRGVLTQVDWVEVRQLRGSDFYAMEQLRIQDRLWLAPWEASSPPGYGRGITLQQYISEASKIARSGSGMYFSILPEGRLAGQVSLSQVHRGAAMSGTLGYWVSSRFVGRGLAPLAVSMVVDWCFVHYGLHRVEIDIRPENQPSLRVVQKLGLRYEGMHKGLLYIDGQWRDHLSYAIVKDEWEPGLLLGRLAQVQS